MESTVDWCTQDKDHKQYNNALTLDDIVMFCAFLLSRHAWYEFPFCRRARPLQPKEVQKAEAKEKAESGCLLVFFSGRRWKLFSQRFWKREWFWKFGATDLIRSATNWLRIIWLMYLIEDPKVHVVAIPDTMDQLRFDMFHGVWRGGVPFAQHETWHPCFAERLPLERKTSRAPRLPRWPLKKT